MILFIESFSSSLKMVVLDYYFSVPFDIFYGRGAIQEGQQNTGFDISSRAFLHAATQVGFIIQTYYTDIWLVWIIVSFINPRVFDNWYAKLFKIMTKFE